MKLPWKKTKDHTPVRDRGLPWRWEANDGLSMMGGSNRFRSWHDRIDSGDMGLRWPVTSQWETKRWAAQLVEEAGAILDGSVLGKTYGTYTRNFPWTLLNRLSHADWDDLLVLAAVERCGPGWLGALSYLASELCALAGSAEGLRSLQKSRLIPLELDVLSGRAVTINTPLNLISEVRSALGRTLPDNFQHTGH